VTYLSREDFKLAFNLTKKYPFLIQTTEYMNTMNYATKLYIKIHELMQTSDIPSAVKLLRILECFDDYKDEALELLTEINYRKKFFNAIEANNIEEAYNLLDMSDYLQYTDDGKKLNSLWRDDFELANFHASNADVKNLKSTLDKYMKMNSKFSSLCTFFSICYINELKIAMAKKTTRLDLETGIINYVSFFGIESKILDFFKNFKASYPDTEIDLEQLKQGSSKSWNPTMIVNSILD
jgi:hypothetical protein